MLQITICNLYSANSTLHKAQITTRHGKSRKHASIALGQIFRKVWKFLDKLKIFGRLSVNAQKSALLATINQFLSESIKFIGRNCNSGQFLHFRNYGNLWTFLNPENFYVWSQLTVQYWLFELMS